MIGSPLRLALTLPLLAVPLPSRPPAPPTVRAAAASAAADIDTTFLKGYRWRSLGPERGGRSIAVSGVRGRPREAYFGATGGGLWKTTDGGETWAPVTDGKINSASVGAVAVSESNPDVVYIGMGESCIRGNIMPGDGVYKSTDAGKTWTHVGFGNSDAIAKIRVHPKDPNTVFVASFGKYGVPSAERGVFKSTDGGKTWKKTLFRDDKTGAVDIAIDPTNPQVMYAALWEAYRVEWQMSSGGPGSGLFKSVDGGETWTEITRTTGMPGGVIGRIGVTVSPVNPQRVWALVENENGGLFRSDDGGGTWAKTTADRSIRQRAFYYTHVFADPKSADVMYALNTSAFRSADAGKTLVQLGGQGNGGTHGDFHDLWIDPENPQHMVVGNDGGGAVTTNGGRTWTEQDFPTPQFYHVVATPHTPFHVCGSQQDANEQCVPTNAGLGFGGRGGGPQVYSPGGSEDGYIAPDPLDPDVFYSGTNANGGGFLQKLNRRTGQVREVSPYPRMFSGEESAVIKERWQWTYPIQFSPVNPRVLYAASQHLWKTTNGGQSWTKISPDLTRHDPKTMGPSGGPITRDMNGPEVYAVIFALGPSKRTANVIWTGSDDGLVHVTRNGGTSWANVTPKEMPDFGRVSIIDASAFDSATAYVAVKRPLLDDRAPYVFRTHDFGKTWTKITNGIPAQDYVHAVREDPAKRGLLYAGTQHGVYVSTDDGDHWQRLSLNLPDVPVADVIVAGNSLAIATHGRGFYILDDLGPLREYAPTTVAADVKLFAPAVATRSSTPAQIRYWLKAPAQKVTVDILDASGKVVRSFVPDTTRRGGRARAAGDSARAGTDSTRAPNDSAATDSAQAGGGGRRGRFGQAEVAPPTTAGLNTLAWDLRSASAISFPGMILWGGATNGPAVPPGRYTVRLNADGKVATAPLTVQRNPTYADVTDADLRAQYALATQIRDKVSEANDAVVRIRDVKTQVADRLKKSTDAQLKTKGDTLTTHLGAVEEDIYQVRNQSGQDPLNFPIKINNRLASLLGVVGNGDGPPIGAADDIFADLKGELQVQIDRLNRVLTTDLPAFNVEARRLGLEPVVVRKPATVLQ
jgi:photosystem II stability/assembly factor-like uncharacterized protein